MAKAKCRFNITYLIKREAAGFVGIIRVKSEANFWNDIRTHGDFLAKEFNGVVVGWEIGDTGARPWGDKV